MNKHIGLLVINPLEGHQGKPISAYVFTIMLLQHILINSETRSMKILAAFKSINFSLNTNIYWSHDSTISWCSPYGL
jgi:hypothetical protein